MMLKSISARRWRTALVACGLALWGASQATAAPLVPFHASDLLAHAVEPFGRSAISMPRSSALSHKWLGVQREVDDELLVLALCEENRSQCSSPAALRFLDIIAAGKAQDGRGRLGQINRALNLAIKPASDQALYGEADVWRAPLALLETGAGDCEDYAIAKYVALRAAGVASDDLRLVILRDTVRSEDHAVASVRLDGHWWLLDNRRMAMVEDINLINHQPLFVIDGQGVRQYRDAPLLANAQQRAVEPAELLKLALRVK
jgi:predicted transglutaminase-like cysteine proteinase